MAKEKILLTEKGLADLKAELKNLVEVEREDVKVQLQEARAQGDLSENADYDAARDRQAQVEARINEIQYMIDNHEIIKDVQGKITTIRIGSVVKFADLSEKKADGTYTWWKNKIVGASEADPFKGRISNESAIAQAILGKKVGDIVEVQVDKPYDIKILEITTE